MGFLDSLKSWLSSEAAEASDLGQQTKGRLETELDRREAELAASPIERMEQLQAQIEGGDDAFDSLRDKIEGRELKAEAVSELAEMETDHLGHDAQAADIDVVEAQADETQVDDANVDDTNGDEHGAEDRP